VVLIGVLASVIGAVYHLTVIKTIYFDGSHYEKTYMYIDIPVSTVLAHDKETIAL
jgi:NADH:ubiquinone oxidoreductase subunit 2 (subunit N)